MIKVLLLDIGKTIVNNLYFKIDKGIDAIYNYTYKEVSLEQFHYYKDKALKFTYQNEFIKNPLLEINCQLFLKLVLELARVNITCSLEELEYHFLMASTNDTAMDGASLFLKKVNELGIRIICVSNSCFSSKLLKRQLNELGLGAYIESVISSSDVGLRKPNSLIYEKAIKLSNVNKEEIIFVGNDYECDYVGSTNVGLKAIHYYNISYQDVFEMIKSCGK